MTKTALYPRQLSMNIIALFLRTVMLNIMQHVCICSYLPTGDSYLTLSARFRVGLSTIHSIINKNMPSYLACLGSRSYANP